MLCKLMESGQMGLIAQNTGIFENTTNSERYRSNVSVIEPDCTLKAVGSYQFATSSSDPLGT